MIVAIQAISAVCRRSTEISQDGSMNVPQGGARSECGAAWYPKSDFAVFFIASGKRSCTEHLVIDTTNVNLTELAEVALQDPARPLILFQGDITVTLETMIVARALPI